MATQTVSDTFTGTDGSPLGVTEVGAVAWQVIAGSWTRTGGQARTGTSYSTNPCAVVDVARADVDVSINVSASGGDCLYFRVQDASNWLRLRVREYTTSSTYWQTVWNPSAYTQTCEPQTSYSPGQVIYQSYDSHGNPTIEGVVTSTSCTGAVGTGGAGWTTNWHQGTDTQYTNYYSNYQVVTEKCVAGTITQLNATTKSGVTSLRAVCSGSTITTYASGTQVWTGSVTDLTGSTKHGIGRGGPTDQSASALDNFVMQFQDAAPNAPALTTPSNNTTVDLSVTNRFGWSFSDPDPGDSQTKFNLYYRVVDTTSWTTVTQATPNQFWDSPAGTFTASNYEWQVETYDSQGVLGARSASAFFTAASVPSDLSITAPTNDSTVPQTTTVTWSTGGQTDYQIQRVADNAGTADTGTIYYDSGDVVSSVARNAVLTFDVNNRYEHILLRIKNSGLWSTYQDVRVQVSYTPPAKSIVACTPVDTLGLGDGSTDAIQVAVSQPTPGAGQPTVVSTDIWRRLAGDGTAGIRIVKDVPASVTWTDYTPASGIAYQYRTVAVGDNGTSTTSDWTP